MGTPWAFGEEGGPEIVHIPDALAESELFEDLTDEQAARLSSMATTVRAGAGEELFRSGEPAAHIYVVLAGEVDLHMAVPEWWGIDTPHRKVSTAKPGQILGWSAMIDASTYSLSAVCATKVTLARFTAADLAHALASDPAMGQKLLARVLRVVSRRFDRLAEAVMAQRAVQASQAASRTTQPA